MVFQILVHPERIERRCVKTREEHIHHDEQIDLALLHPLREILIVVLERIAIRGEIRVKLRVVVRNRIIKKISARAVKGLRIEVLIGQRILGIVLIRRIAEDGRDRETPSRLSQLTAKLLVVRHADRD